MRKIKVLQFGSSMGLFGAERWILALVRYCDTNHVENIVFTIKDAPDAPVGLIEKAEEMGFRTDLIHARGPFDPRTIFRTASLIRKHKVDILHTHGYKSDIIGYWAAKLAGIPIISTPHGSELSVNNKLNIYIKVDDWFLKWIDLVVPVSEGLRDEYLEKGLDPDKIKVIKNGVDILEVEESTPHQDYLSMKHESKVKLVGYVGQLIERKGLPNLLRAMKIVNKDVSAKLVLVGDGPKRGELEHIAIAEGLSEKIEFLGFRSDRLKVMKCFDVFVLPSYLEGIPRVIMEAMAAGIPVVATDIPGVQEIVHHNNTGLLVQTDSPEELAEKIIGLLNNTEKADELKQNALKYVKSHHSSERMASEYCKLYKDLLNVNNNG